MVAWLDVGSRRLGGREDGDGERGYLGAEVMSLVVALSCSSCALRLRGPPDVGEEVDESRRYHKGAQTKEWCARACVRYVLVVE